MAERRIEYIAPTSRSFAGMKLVLFQPFDIGKWFVLGFTAWLAALADGGGSGGGGGGNVNTGGSGSSSGGPQSAGEVWEEVSTWIEQNLEAIILIGSLVLFVLLALGIALLWVSSRGKFMFLDNVVHNRALVRDPWTRFRTHGNSLFWWRLIFSVIVFGVVLLIGGATVLMFAGLGGGDEIIIPGLVGGGLALFVFLILAGYVGVLLEDFVVPLMYRDSVTTTVAWKRFLTLHGSATGSFILYALWRFVLGLGVGLAIAVVGIATCCIGLILFSIPYLGTVILLPVPVFFRFLGPEFLRQFGMDYDIMPPAPELPAPTS